MPNAIAKVIVFVSDIDASLELIESFAGDGVVRRFESPAAMADAGMGWADLDGMIQIATVGTPPGLLELCEIPPGMVGKVVPGSTVLSFSVRDVEERAAAAEAAGFDVRGPLVLADGDRVVSTLAQLRAADLQVEIARYER